MKGKKIIIILIGLLLANCNSPQSKTVQSTANDSIFSHCDYVPNFRLTSEDYKETTAYIPDDGYVPNAEIAYKIAEIVLLQIYGIERINNQKPFSINLFRGVWVIEGNLNCIGCDGGVAYIEIQKSDGKILKVIHTK
jgi:hypothetical protein